jgi:hypothetical protein
VAHLERWAKKKMKKSTLIYLISNLAGCAIYFILALHIRSEIRTEERAYVDFGDSLNFAMTALPVFLVCCVYSLFWCAKVSLDFFRGRSLEGLRALVALMIAVNGWSWLIVGLRDLPL